MNKTIIKPLNMIKNNKHRDKIMKKKQYINNKK